MKLPMREAWLWLGTMLALAAMPAVAAATQPCSVEAKTNGDQAGVTAGATVTLNGQPSKGADTYVWSQDPGDAFQVALTVPNNKAQATFTAPSVGGGGATLHFTLVVTGCSPVQTGSTSVTITIVHVQENQPPLASATAPATVHEGESIALDGSGSSDPDGDPLTYAWAQVIGGTAQTPFSTTAVASFAAPPAPYPDGLSLTFRLTVSDGSLSASTDKIVTVQHVNVAPVASAQCTATVDEAGPVLLDGSASKDSDDGIASYSWSQVLGGPDANLASDALAQPSFSFDAPKLTFGHGDTMTFSLKVTDKGGLYDAAQCAVKVVDKTPPAVTVPRDAVVAEATSPAGAVVEFSASATDDYDGSVEVDCTPASGATYAVGDTVVTCSAADRAGNGASASFTVTVRDTKPPVMTTTADVTAEATGPNGAVVTFASPVATDIVDGVVPVTCLPASGTMFAFGTTAVTCSARDRAGNAATRAFDVTVQDTTPPVLTMPADLTLEATGPAGASATFAPSATDLVDGAVAVDCSPASLETFPLGTTTVTCSAKDGHANEASASFLVTVEDTTPPTVNVPGDVAAGPTLLTGAYVKYSDATATDLVDGLEPVVDCEPKSNSLFGFGKTTVTCSATDQHGNTGTASFSVTVEPFTFLGFFQPVDPKALNVVKAGATVPLKWKLQGEGGLEITDTNAVRSITALNVNCTSSATNDTQDEMATGGTTLRYDFTSSQFVFNWATVKAPGSCWRVEVAFTDGAAPHVANFKLK